MVARMTSVGVAAQPTVQPIKEALPVGTVHTRALARRTESFCIDGILFTGVYCYFASQK